jgi:hypothetical protein
MQKENVSFYSSNILYKCAAGISLADDAKEAVIAGDYNRAIKLLDYLIKNLSEKLKRELNIDQNNRTNQT